MTFTADSPLVAKVVPSPSSERGPRSEIRAIVIHHAEGGGTVSWLTRPDGNSSHYVVEYTGRIVQMVPEREWAGSMNPKLTRTSDDAPFIHLGERIVYGATALKAAGIASDPNRYAIAIEVEGFAKAGPNSDQRVALRKLVADIRQRRGPLHVLGHRDQQSYKACPGKLIPWADYGGHGPASEDSMAFVVSGAAIGVATLARDSNLVDLVTGASVPKTVGYVRNVYQHIAYNDKPGYLVTLGGVPHFMRAGTFSTYAPHGAPDIEAARQEASQAATTAERTRARGIARTAIETLGGI